jgi:CelD/BcsL family acetyltransferase involved in cellulose biosynthesis
MFCRSGAHSRVPSLVPPPHEAAIFAWDDPVPGLCELPLIATCSSTEHFTVTTSEVTAPPIVNRRVNAAGQAGTQASPVVLPIKDSRWLFFVSASQEATPFHHPAWSQVLTATYGFPSFAIALLKSDEVMAGAPFLAVRGLRRRLRWISLPFTDSCSPLAITHGAKQAFLDSLGRPALGVPQIELRSSVEAVGWRTRADAVFHDLDLVPDPDDLKSRFSKTQVVRNIARAEREGVVVRRAESMGDLDTFFGLHLATRRRQGVPVQPRVFFAEIWTRLIENGLGSILLAELDGQAVAGGLFLSWNGTTIYKFGASQPEAWPSRPNHALFWSAICESCARGDRRFDFGRTELANHGLRAFKAAWGAIERPLVYSVLSSGAAQGSEGIARRALASVIRASPAWLCRRLGEALYRYAA